MGFYSNNCPGWGHVRTNAHALIFEKTVVAKAISADIPDWNEAINGP